MIPFFEEVDVVATVCDHGGRITKMNEQSRQVNLKLGQSLVSKNVLDCYPEPACLMPVNTMEHQTKCVHIIIKGDEKKLIY